MKTSGRCPSIFTEWISIYFRRTDIHLFYKYHSGRGIHIVFWKISNIFWKISNCQLHSASIEFDRFNIRDKRKSRKSFWDFLPGSCCHYVSDYSVICWLMNFFISDAVSSALEKIEGCSPFWKFNPIWPSFYSCSSVCIYSSLMSSGTRLPPVAHTTWTAFCILLSRPFFRM